MFVVRYEAQRSSAKPHSAEFILSLPKGFVRDYEPNVTLSSYTDGNRFHSLRKPVLSTLPVAVMGSVSRNSMPRGYL